MAPQIKGGTKFTRAINELVRKMSDAKVVQVGFFENATYPNGTTVASVAANLNYGFTNWITKQRVGPWPFFSNMVADKSPDWPKAIELNLKATNYDAAKTLELVGLGIEGQLKQSIKDTNSPPLKQSTIDRKGFDKPLIDTSHMINSTGHRVKT